MHPEPLLIYYGWPSCLNGGRAPEEDFSRYRQVVLGDGLEDPAHPDHQRTAAIIAACPLTRFHGYVDLGVTTRNLSLDEVARRCERWRGLGCQGVLLDDFGYDFGTTRERQNAAVDRAHAEDLMVIANAWKPDDAFSLKTHRCNPKGQPPRLGRQDVFLVESYQVRLGVPETVRAWRQRAERLEDWRRRWGFAVYSCATSASERPFQQELFDYSYTCAFLDNHQATGWGEPGWSAGDAQAPFRPRPQVSLGSRRMGSIRIRGEQALARTDAGIVQVGPSGVRVASLSWWQRLLGGL